MLLAILGNGAKGQLEEYSEQPEGKENYKNEGDVADRQRGRRAGSARTQEDHDLRLKEYDEIHRSMSRGSARSKESATQASVVPNRQKSTIAYSGESPKTVGNAWSPFSWFNADTAERRYSDDDEEERDRAQQEALRNGATGADNESPGDDEDFDGNAIGAEGAEVADDDRGVGGGTSRDEGMLNDGETGGPEALTEDNADGSRGVTGLFGASARKRRGKSRFFRNRSKKPVARERKQSVYCIEDDDEEGMSYFTGKRAQQLIGLLAAGSPAINILALCLLEDEHGITRAPLLLSLLGLTISDISQLVNTKNRKFKIDLEYGVGEERLRWSVERSASDLLYLHSRFKLDNWRKEVARTRNIELPKVPIPQLRGNTQRRDRRNTHKSSPGETLGNLLAVNNGQSRRESLSNDADRESITSAHTIREQILNLRTYFSNMSSMSDDDQSPERVKSKMQRNQEYINQVSQYLNDLINSIELTPQSNRLFHFFEISPILSLLSYETGFQGKQGLIHIGGTTRTQGWRVGHFKANDLKGMIDRRSVKWLLIRNTYLMYVSDINLTLPLEVFLVDPKFHIDYKGNSLRKRVAGHIKSSTGNAEGEVEEDDDEVENFDDKSITQKDVDNEANSRSSKKNKLFKHLKITLTNSERQLVLIPKSEKEQKLWIKSLQEMQSRTVWADHHRFDSFAPVRDNCFAQWFVDGRDYFWAVSLALEMAKDVIFIHDWWLSPELYLRRPANGNQQWRIDRLLQRKAQQGVKIFVIVYRNVGTTVATDSLYTKHSILLLDEENIHVIRSPNQLLQNTYFWAHHEKLCIIDQTVAFLGGIDLCYGRFDTADHVLVDDSNVTFETLKPDGRPTTEDHIKFQTFPGKDYSNPRVKDFFDLHKPYESMYDREEVPRMPWHDVHMVTSGKIASDLARHFVQRWNYLLRQKRPSRFTPLLTPPPDFTDEEVHDMGLGGTCEVQLLRSSGAWSLGLQEHEQSIQNAYLRLIETSEHFVYIENQFFITACVVDGTEIRNRIGDALVDRIIRAHKEGTNWRAVIVIPLMPGFESQVDEPDGSSVRVIMQCQYMSISRGATSIFAKLKKYGIEPDDYIQFFSLRKWGLIGPDRNLVTEQLYIHAKTMVVDDRTAIIGSANINERSMRGVRDSEVAAVIRDKETVKTMMNGEPYVAGKFAHTLRMRLMREHLGVNVDILEIVERRFRKFELYANTESGIKACTGKFSKRKDQVMSAMVEVASRDILGAKMGTKQWKKYQDKLRIDENEVFEVANHEEVEAELDEEDGPTPLALPISFNNRTGTYEANKGIRDKKKHSYDPRVQQNNEHKRDVLGYGTDKYKSKLAKRARLQSSKFLRELAHKSMMENPTGIFLPNMEEVEEFLVSDDTELSENMGAEESEKIITERNRERWMLLKKISYMQRVAAKEKEQRDEESKKKCEAGFEKLGDVLLRKSSHPKEEVNGSDGSEEKHESARNTVPAGGNSGVNGKSLSNSADVDGGLDEPSDLGVNPGLTGASDTHFNENVPIISLGDQGVVDLMQSINPKSYEDFSTFVDPYGFEDPLDDEFYEDLWYEHAKRNTEIYRMVFHTQPDNYVATWKDYKRYSKLQSAFIWAQKQEAKHRRHKQGGEIGDDSGSEVSSNARDDFKRKSVAMRDSSNVGLLGDPPQTPEPESESTATKKNGTLKGKRDQKSDSREPKDISQEAGADPGTDALDYTSPNLEDKSSVDTEDDDEPDGTHIEVDGEKLPSRHDDIAESEENETDVGPDREHKNADENFFRRQKRRRRAGTFSARRKALTGDRIYDRATAERILSEIQGHLVFFPADWLMRELEGGNWFYNTDRIPPIEIYD